MKEGIEKVESKERRLAERARLAEELLDIDEVDDTLYVQRDVDQDIFLENVEKLNTLQAEIFNDITARVAEQEAPNKLKSDAKQILVIVGGVGREII